LPGRFLFISACCCHQDVMTDERVALTHDGALSTLWLNRPDKRNALDQAMWERIPLLVDEALARAETRVLLLRSAAEGVFCAGADIAEFAARSGDAAWRAANQAAIRAAQLALSRAGIPTIAAVDGDCVGGGCGLALACDLRIASPRSRFGITPARLGLVYPLHDTKLLVEAVGPAHAKRMLFTADLLEAEEAAAIGLVTGLTDDPATAAQTLAWRMLMVSGDSQRWVKATIRRILDGATDDDETSMALFDQAFTGPDFREGVSAFLERRKPDFRR
jgi:enoyl-CoA hydratase/carnithine racemase